jgi:AcrR family transcriptional regulator
MNTVQKGGGPINTVVTSREAILAACREMVAEQGLGAIGMRAVAARCGVAVGSLYNYFPSKDALLAAAVESVWEEIFRAERPEKLSFPDYVAWLFGRVRRGTAAYPDFFAAHSLRFAAGEKGRARQTMESYFARLRAGMAAALHADPAVRADAFGPDLSEEAFLDFVLTALLALLVRQSPDCGALLAVIRRSVCRS